MGIIADELKVIKKELNNARLSINAKYKLADIQELTSMTITQLPPSIDYIPVLDLSGADVQDTDILKNKIGFAANGMVVGAMPNHSGVELLSNITKEDEKNITFNITKNRKGYCDEYTRFLVDKALLADFLGITPNIIKQGENILGIEGQYQGATPIINQDTDGDGVPDVNVDTNNDGIPDINIDTTGDGNPNINIDTTGDGSPNLNIDTTGDLKPNVNIDINNDKEPEVNIDTDGDGLPDTNLINQDTDGDGKPDLNVDTNGDNIPDLNIDTDGDNTPDLNVDTNDDNEPDINIDTNKDGKSDMNIDTNGDNVPDISVDTNDDKVPDTNIDINGDNVPDINIDTDNDGKPDTNLVDTDIDGDNKPDLNIDTNGDDIPDLNIDTNKDGKPDVNVDLNEDNKPDINVDINKDGEPDFNVDTNNDNIPDLNIDTNNDEKPDVNIDVNGDNIPDVNIDTNGDNIPDTNLINQDTNGDGKQDLNVDTDGDNIPDLNVDVNGDGVPDLGIDTNGDGIPDLNIDTNKDGKPDVNVDTNDDKKPDLNIDDNNDNIPDRNIDTNNDKVPDLNIDVDNNNEPNYSILNTKTKTLSIIVNTQNIEEAAEKYGTTHNDVSHYGLIYNKNDYGAHTIVNNGYYKHGNAEINYGGKPIRPINYIWNGSEITFLIKKHGNHLTVEVTDFNTDIENDSAKIDILLDDYEFLKCFTGKVHFGFASQDLYNAAFKNIYFNGKYEIETEEDGKTYWLYYKQNEDAIKEFVTNGIKDTKTLGVTLKGDMSEIHWIAERETIEALGERVSFNYIVSENEYEDYILKVTISSSALDCGIAGIIIAYIEDEEIIENPINEDLNKDSIPDLNIDTNKDGIPDTNIDTDGDKKPDLNIDTNRDGIPDVNVDTNGDGVPDLSIDTNGDNIPDLDIDTNNDGIPDVNIDDTGDKIPDRNIDTNGDNDPDLNVDTNNDGTYDTDIDINGDGIPDINEDTDNDGVPDKNVDTDNDGYPDLNVDTDNDGIPDTNIDSDGDGIPDTNVQDITPDNENYANPENTVDPTVPENADNLDKVAPFEYDMGDDGTLNTRPWLLKWGWREIEISNEFTTDQKRRYLTAYRRMYNCINTYGEVSTYSITNYDTGTTGDDEKDLKAVAYVYQDEDGKFWWVNEPKDGYSNSLVTFCYLKDLKLNRDEVEYVYNKMLKDSPEIMWKFGERWHGDEYTDADGNTYDTSFQMEVFEWADRQAYLATCENSFNEICDIIDKTYGIKYDPNCTPSTYSPLEKKKIAKVIHDYLVTHNSYAHSSTPLLDQTMYPALSNGVETPVCASYAHAFYWCCQRFGILCLIVTGYAGENHMWNMITYQPFHLRMNLDYISQKQFWQEVDVTWDDQLFTGGTVISDFCSWEFFNVTTDYMKSENAGERYRFYSDLGYTWFGPYTYDSYICEDCQDQSNKYLNGQFTTQNGGKLYEGF